MRLRAVNEGTIGGQGDPLVIGDDASRQAAREVHRREQRIRTAMRGGWPELKRADLVFSRFAVEHVPSAAKYKIHHGEVDAVYTPISAYYFDQVGDVIFLESA